MLNEIIVQSWSQLQDALYLDDWDPKLQRYRSQFAFRGLSDSAYELKHRLMRLGGSFVEIESNLIRNFRKYSLRNVVESDSIWHWLSMAQHHSLPTRLLDWTFSPFVAMHFATDNIEKYDRDSVIWAVNYCKLHELLPDKLKEKLRTESADIFTVEMLSSIFQSLGDLRNLTPEPFLLFFEPPSIDDRIVNQFALFSVMSDPEIILNEWLSRYKDLWRKIIIPAGLKWEIRDRLDQANITERVLFPSLDGLSRWLARYYSPRNGK